MSEFLASTNHPSPVVPSGPRPVPSPTAVAVVGATGAVGAEMLRCLEQRQFPLSALHLYASARSAGRETVFAGKRIAVRELREDTILPAEIALFSAGSDTSRRFARAFVERGAVVIDNSSAFRADPLVPLVIPEVNAAALSSHRGIVASPNCVAAIVVMALAPIHRCNPLRRLRLSTYQAASGAGAAAMGELLAATRARLDDLPFAQTVLPHPCAFNVFSHNTPIDPATGYNEEEAKVMNETRRLLSAPRLGVSATCVRVPTLRAHCVSVDLECARPIDAAEARRRLAEAPGLELVDDAGRNYFPMAIDATQRDAILVGRIRADLSGPPGRSLSLFIAGDQLLKGAALNTVQIAERLIAYA